jgi:hypothetical protein
MFYLDVAYVFQWFQVFLGVSANVSDFQTHVQSVSSAFRRMLQVLHLNLNILKVDQMLHLPSRYLLSHFGVSSSSSQRRLGIRLLPLFSMLMTLGATRIPRGGAKRRKKKL